MASLLAMHWKTLGYFPDIQAFAFASPCIAPEDFAENQREYITSVVLENDLVPRLSIFSAEELRDRIYKLQISEEVMVEVEGAIDEFEAIQTDLKNSRDRGDFSDTIAQLEQRLVAIGSELSAVYRQLCADVGVRPKLCPLGRILHLTDDKCVVKHQKNFQEIVVSADMVTSHLNCNYKSAIDKL